MKVRKKPVVIEAEQFLGTAPLPFRDEHVCCYDGRRWYLYSLEGPLYFNIGDWIIKGVRGEFYAIKKDIFEETYEHAE